MLILTGQRGHRPGRERRRERPGRGDPSRVPGRRPPHLPRSRGSRGRSRRRPGGRCPGHGITRRRPPRCEIRQADGRITAIRTTPGIRSGARGTPKVVRPAVQGSAAVRRNPATATPFSRGSGAVRARAARKPPQSVRRHPSARGSCQFLTDYLCRCGCCGRASPSFTAQHCAGRDEASSSGLATSSSPRSFRRLPSCEAAATSPASARAPAHPAFLAPPAGQLAARRQTRQVGRRRRERPAAVRLHQYRRVWPAARSGDVAMLESYQTWVLPQWSRPRIGRMP
jgi:hypothetical protein